MSKQYKEIDQLIKKASEEDSSLYAMQLTQAALNAANALRVLVDIPAGKSIDG